MKRKIVTFSSLTQEEIKKLLSEQKTEQPTVVKSEEIQKPERKRKKFVFLSCFLAIAVLSAGTAGIYTYQKKQKSVMTEEVSDSTEKTTILPTTEETTEETSVSFETESTDTASAAESVSQNTETVVIVTEQQVEELEENPVDEPEQFEQQAEIPEENIPVIQEQPPEIPEETYTAVQLAKMKPSEIAKILGTYTLTDYFFPYHWGIYNDDKIFNIRFGVDADYSSENYQVTEEDNSNLRNMIETDACNLTYISSGEFETFHLPENFPVTDSISTSFDYRQCAEILGDFECEPVGAASFYMGRVSQLPIGQKFEIDGCMVCLIFMDFIGHDTPGYRTYTAEEMRELNPKLISFEVSPLS